MESAACFSVAGYAEAFVEHHGDIRIQHLLDAHRLFRREEQAIPVHRGGEMHAFFGDLAQRLEAEDLKAARVGEDGRASS